MVPGLVSDIDGSVTYSASDDAETYSVVDEVARRALLHRRARSRRAPGRIAGTRAAGRDPSPSTVIGCADHKLMKRKFHQNYVHRLRTGAAENG